MQPSAEQYSGGGEQYSGGMEQCSGGAGPYCAHQGEVVQHICPCSPEPAEHALRRLAGVLIFRRLEGALILACHSILLPFNAPQI